MCSASYGKQLSRIGDALVALLNHFHPRTPLTEEEAAAIDDLKKMLQRIADVKGKHKRKALPIR
jgi:Ser/Thr protein kinase RdoA (MazF antagonist)